MEEAQSDRSPGAVRVGRAVERAELVARALDAYLLAAGERAPDEDRRIARALLAAFGAGSTRRGADSVLATASVLALDRHEEASAACAIAFARDEARRARETMPADLWECLNTTRSRLPRKVSPERAHEFLGWLGGRATLAIGVMETDAAGEWVRCGFTVGRMLERVEMTARFVASGLLPDDAWDAWFAVLRATGTSETYLRFHRGSQCPATAATFLFCDTQCPRSLRACLDRAADLLRRMRLEREAALLERAAAEVGAVHVGGLDVVQSLAVAVARTAHDVSAMLDPAGRWAVPATA